MAINTSRHKDYFDSFKQGKVPITIIGAGATGSRVFEALVNLGMTDITVFDYDIVESHNLANQLFSAGQIGDTKVGALEYWMFQKTGAIESQGKFIEQRVKGNMKSAIKGIVFLLTDTMSSRKEIYENSLRINGGVQLVIETRMALTHGNILAFDPKNTRQSHEWADTLISDDEPTTEVSLCGTALTIGTTANVIANLAVQYMIDYLRGDKPDPIIDIFLNPLMISTKCWEN